MPARLNELQLVQARPLLGPTCADCPQSATRLIRFFLDPLRVALPRDVGDVHDQDESAAARRSGPSRPQSHSLNVKMYGVALISSTMLFFAGAVNRARRNQEVIVLFSRKLVDVAVRGKGGSAALREPQFADHGLAIDARPSGQDRRTPSLASIQHVVAFILCVVPCRTAGECIRCAGGPATKGSRRPSCPGSRNGSETRRRIGV